MKRVVIRWNLNNFTTKYLYFNQVIDINETPVVDMHEDGYIIYKGKELLQRYATDKEDIWQVIMEQ